MFVKVRPEFSSCSCCDAPYSDALKHRTAMHLSMDTASLKSRIRKNFFLPFSFKPITAVQNSVFQCLSSLDI